jgi:deoxyribonuclease-4
VWIGSHVSTGGELRGAIPHALEVGAEAIQIWGSNPRAWRPPNVSREEVARFREARREAGLGPVFLHSPYMVNVASPDRGMRRRSVELARATVELAESMGATGVVVHAGAAGRSTAPDAALEAAAHSFRSIVEVADETLVCVELMAGTTGSVASTFADYRRLLDACDRDRRLALCADTCHLFAAGYALDTPSGVAEAFDELRRLRLASRLALVHANDSMYPRGEHRDAHEHIGKGHIGERGFRAILADAALAHVAVVCETRGGTQEHRDDVAALKRLAGRTAPG